MRAAARWRDHPARVELLKLFEEADAIVRASASACTCASTTSQDDALCCQFTRNGREPYPTPVELCEVDYGMRARGISPKRPIPSGKPARRRLNLVAEGDDHGACPLLSAEGRCTIYASRPFGCRTYFCPGHEPPKRAREEIQRIGRRLSDLAARFFPRDPLTRPFTRALAGALPQPPDFLVTRA